MRGQRVGPERFSLVCAARGSAVGAPCLDGGWTVGTGARSAEERSRSDRAVCCTRPRPDEIADCWVRNCSRGEAAFVRLGRLLSDARSLRLRFNSGDVVLTGRRRAVLVGCRRPEIPRECEE